jgi:hypothetical protein
MICTASPITSSIAAASCRERSRWGTMACTLVTRGGGRWRSLRAGSGPAVAAVTPRALRGDVEHADLKRVALRSLRAVELATKPLDAETWPDFARLAEDHHGVWDGCWCLNFHEEGAPLSDHRLIQAAHQGEDSAGLRLELASIP